MYLPNWATALRRRRLSGTTIPCDLCTHQHAHARKQCQEEGSQAALHKKRAPRRSLGVARAPRSATQRKHESFQARQETRARPGKGGGHRTHLENVGRGYLDRLSPREGRGVAFLGEIALLASPRSTQAGLSGETGGMRSAADGPTTPHAPRERWEEVSG
jgi:hypothetical protein